ncbi:MAG: glycosyltransferase family 4 protein [Gemmatimonadetes bacterium]|nr:glycosyltransferase family 4 protein [Gemmatimonadota bacterium]
MLETDGPGGAEVVVLNMGHELRDRGHAVVPVGPAHGWLSQRFRESGFEPEPFSLRQTLDPFAVRDLADMMRRLEIDVVHSHEFTMAVYGTAACKLAGRPHVITMHGSQTMTRVLRRRFALRWAFRNSYATAAVSEATKVQVDHDLGIGADVIGLIRNGVPIPQGDPDPVRRELGVQDGEVLVLAVGNLDARKGHIFLLEALQRLSGQGVGPWRLAIAGGRGGPEKPRLEAFAAEHDMEDRFHILEYRNDIPNLLAAADILAMPSLWEGLPLAILEAMLAGTAIVASEASGIPEAIDSGEHGLLTAAGDSDALADALGKLIRDRAFRERLAHQAQERALKEFTVGAMTDAYEDLYRAALT